MRMTLMEVGGQAPAMMGRSRAPAIGSPVATYLARLGSANSRKAMDRALCIVAGCLDGGLDDRGGPFGDPWRIDWSAVCYEDVVAIRGRLLETPDPSNPERPRWSPKTVNLCLSGLRGVLREVWRQGGISGELLMRLSDVPAVKDSAASDDDAAMAGRRLEPAEITAIDAALRATKSPIGLRDHALFAVAYLSAARRSEVVGLDLDDFDERSLALRIRRGKGGKSRTVYLHNHARGPLRRWLRFRGRGAGPLLCPLGRSGELPDPITRLSAQSLYAACVRWARLAELDPFSPHDLRRSWVSAALENGADLFSVQRQAGHSQSTTTQRYDRRAARGQQKAAQLVGLHQ